MVLDKGKNRKMTIKTWTRTKKKNKRPKVIPRRTIGSSGNDHSHEGEYFKGSGNYGS